MTNKLSEQSPVQFSSVTAGITTARKTRCPLRSSRRPLFSGSSPRRSIPTTPRLQWKFKELSNPGHRHSKPCTEIFPKPRKTAVSVRRLTAAISNLWIPNVILQEKMSSNIKINQNTSAKLYEAMEFELNRERKRSRSLKNLNLKLLNELTATKLATKKILKEYEKVRKDREILSEACSELANEIGDGKAAVEAMKAESAKKIERVEEERRMMQLAEVWREEQVHMKLIEARITLEEKYSQVSLLEEEIEDFLKSMSGNQYDVVEMRQAESLKEAIESATKHDSVGIVQFLEGIEERHMKRYDNMMFDGNCGVEDESWWESVGLAEKWGSRRSPEGSEPSVNGGFVERRGSVRGTDDGGDEKQNSEIWFATARRSRKKGVSMSRPWKSFGANKAEELKKICLGSSNLLNSSDMNEQGLMRKLMEEGVQSQKVQIRQILREKI